MNVQDFDLPVSVINPELDRERPAHVDRDFAPNGIALYVVGPIGWKIANLDKPITNRSPHVSRQSLDINNNAVVDEQTERFHVGSSVLLG
jgi:hypothetical protein